MLKSKLSCRCRKALQAAVTQANLMLGKICVIKIQNNILP